jgi:sugar phosphate isomerase/epimerase
MATETETVDSPPSLPGAILSVVVSQAFPGLFESQLPIVVRRIVGELGFRAIEIVSIADAQVREEVRTVLESVEATAIVLGGLPLLKAGLNLSSDGDERAQAVAFACQLADEADSFGARALLLTSGRDVDEGDRPAAQARLRDSLLQVCEYAQGRGFELQVRLEPTDRNLRHRQLIGPTQEALAIATHIGRRVNNFDLNLDLSHLLQLGENPLEEIRRASDHCHHVHLANCVLGDPTSPLFGERHPPFGYPGSDVGVQQLAIVLRTLSNAGYFATNDLSTVGLEVVPPSDAEPWSVLEQARHDLLSAIALASDTTSDIGDEWIPFTASTQAVDQNSKK